MPRIKKVWKYTFEGCIIFILSEMVRLLALKIILEVEKLSRRWRPGRIGYSRPDFITSLLKSYNFISLQSLNMNKYRIRKKPEGSLYFKMLISLYVGKFLILINLGYFMIRNHRKGSFFPRSAFKKHRFRFRHMTHMTDSRNIARYCLYFPFYLQYCVFSW